MLHEFVNDIAEAVNGEVVHFFFSDLADPNVVFVLDDLEDFHGDIGFAEKR